MIRVLFFGDVVGRSGLEALSFFLPLLREKEKADFVIVNGENAAKDGRGITYEDYLRISSFGADAITLGNHFDRKGEIIPHLDEESRLIRPEGYDAVYQGSSSRVFMAKGVPIRVSNVMGSGLMDRDYASPFVSMDRILEKSQEKVHIVDLHGESTSEKAIFAHRYSSSLSAVVGTHTHVQTADERIVNGREAFISDVGMTGAGEGIIGFDPRQAISRFLYHEEARIRPLEKGELMANACLIAIDEASGEAISIKRINERKKR